MYEKLIAVALCLAAALGTTTANAALLSRLGGKAYYDNVANLTWLQDANYANTSGYAAGGLMDWDNAATYWASSLNIDGVRGWRLPGQGLLPPAGGLPPSFGFDPTGEMGNLFYNVLGGVAGSSISTTHNANYNLFSNIHAYGYWSGASFGGSGAYFFNFGNGAQDDFTARDDKMFAWAVHSGDVGTLRPVPLPAAAFLLAPAVGGLGFMRRRAA